MTIPIYYASAHSPSRELLTVATGLDMELHHVAQTAELAGYSGLEHSLRHGALQLSTIRSCLVVLADLTPYAGRLIDPDALTAVGVAGGMGRPVFAFSEVSREAAEAHGLPIPRLAAALVKSFGSAPLSGGPDRALCEVDRWLRACGYRH